MTDTPPSNAESVLEILTNDFDRLSPQLQRAARYLIENPREVGVRSMRALAAKAEVHPNTLIRLAREIGFEGYDQLRERFRDFVVADGLGSFRDRAKWLQDMAAHGGSAEVVAEMAAATSQNVEVMWKRQEPAVLDAVADAILKAPRVYVLGMGSAYSLAHQFWYVARMAFSHIQPIPRHGSQPVDDLAWAQPDDVLMALTFQPYRSETMQAVRQARKIGCTIIGVTDSVTSPLAKLSDHLLISPTHTPHFFQSHAAVTAQLEGLIAVLVARAGEDASGRIESFHKQRLAAGLYEEPALLAKLG